MKGGISLENLKGVIVKQTKTNGSGRTQLATN